ncbi:hypothetical protein [Stenotrophomonas sp. P5_B8]
MAVKKGEAPAVIPAKLSFSGTGEKFKLDVKFRNVNGKEYRAAVDDGKNLAELVFLVVDEWDADYPLSVEGIMDFEDERAGICEGLLMAYHRARRVELEKN